MANIYGLLPVLEALRAGGRRIERIVIAEGARPERVREILDEARRAGIPTRREPRARLDRLVNNANHQGVVAVASAVGYIDEEKILAGVGPDTLLILLDGVEDPHNLGAIIRTAECGGATAVVIPERRAAHVTETVAKTSAGAAEYLPIARVTNMVQFIERLKQKNVWVAGLDQGGEMDYTKYDYRGALALVFGAEGGGLHRLVRERCDVILSIPMRGHIGSLNVSVAVGVVLFEALRQRAAAS